MTLTNLRALKLLVAALLLPLAAASTQAQDWAKTRLEASPRHHEYVPLKHGNRTVQAFVVYPEVKTKAPVVVLIHEIFGLTDWAKEMADELADQGFIVVAPDLLTGFGPNGGGSSAFPDQDSTIKAVSALDPAVVNADLDAAADYGKHLPAANGKIVMVSVGMSNTTMKFQTFLKLAADDHSLNPRLLLVDGAQNSQTAWIIANPKMPFDKS